MFTFFLVVHALIAAALVTVILMQRSEGGGLGMGGSPSGLMSARGAADFLTRATTVLATLFVGMSILLAALASMHGGPRQIDTSLVKPSNPGAPLPSPTPDPAGSVPLVGAPALPAAGATSLPVAPPPATGPTSAGAAGADSVLTQPAPKAAEPTPAPKPVVKPRPKPKATARTEPRPASAPASAADEPLVLKPTKNTPAPSAPAPSNGTTTPQL